MKKFDWTITGSLHREFWNDRQNQTRLPEHREKPKTLDHFRPEAIESRVQAWLNRTPLI